MESRIMLYALLILLGLQFTACRPYDEEAFSDISFELQDSLFQRIYGFQHRQLTDSLVPYFSHEDPAYRYLAALAFGSVMDSTVIDSLASLLRDRVDEVRAGAAFAIGQQGSSRAESMLINAFNRFDTTGRYKLANRAILEAIGKIGTMTSLRLLSTVKTYQSADTALLEGQAWGIYRYALRGLTAPEGTERMLELATDARYPPGVRLIAANYLYRARDIRLDSLAGVELARAIFNEKDPEIRMALAIGLGKTGTDTALDALVNLYNLEADYRVKCNIISALGNFDYSRAQAMALEALHDPNVHIASRAAGYFLDNGVPEDATLYWRLTRDSLPWQASTRLFAAALRYLPAIYGDYRAGINGQLRQFFRLSESPFQKAAALQALTEWPWNFRFIAREGFLDPDPMVRGAAVQALAGISLNEGSSQGMDAWSITRELSIYFRQAIESGDPAMMAPAAAALRQPGRNYRLVIDSLSFLESALEKTDSSRDFFTYAELQSTLGFLKGLKNTAPPEPPVKPIDWSLLTRSSIEPMALIETNKGVIQVRLSPKIAPASVANFIELAQSDYYLGKYFYRVVPNFVIQGVESLEHEPVSFTLRSELRPVHFAESGLLGMASSGRHTESTQFFITHSPAPHLDGNYTLFGRVVEGMEVVNQIQEGDSVKKIIIQFR